MERVTLLSQETIVDPLTLGRLCLPQPGPEASGEPEPSSAERELPDEAARIQEVLSRTGGNVVQAVRLLGVSRNSLRYRMQRYGIGRPSWKEITAPRRPGPTGATTQQEGDRERSAGMPPQEQVTDSEQMPVAAIGAAQRSSFVGRDRELADFRRAGEEAAARAEHREAAACFEQALAALQHLPESREAREQAVDLRLCIGDSLVPLGEFGRALDYLREAESLAEALDDYRPLGRVYAGMAFMHWLQGDHDRAIASGRRALAIAKALGDVAPQTRANLLLGWVYVALGDYPQAMDCFGRNLVSREGGLPAVLSRAWSAWCLAELGAFADGMAHGEASVREVETVDPAFSRVMAPLGLGYLYLRKGDLDKAIPLLERALAGRQGGEFLIWSPWVTSALGSAYAHAGRIAEALPLLEQAVENAVSMGIMAHQALRLAWLSEAYLLAGYPKDAKPLVGRALALARDHKERGHEAHVLRLLADIAAHGDPPDIEPAEASYRQALAMADELGMRPLVAQCHLGLGTLYARMERPEAAHAELSAAIELFHAMDMTLWQTRAEAALARAG